MEPREFEIAVIGGGIQGAGVAQAAAAAGYSVLLLERRDWGDGTSSRSSKLIHGGLRYLESGQWSLVRKALAERSVLLRIAPGLVRPVPFLIPLYRNSQRRPWQVGLGLRLYRMLAAGADLSNFERLGLESDALPAQLKRGGLRAVFRYWDAQTDDRLLTRGVVASAAGLGVELNRGAELREARAVNGGWRISWQQGTERLEGSCRVLVNATGPWVNRVMDRLNPRPRSLPMEMVQGTHLVLDAELGGAVYYLEAEDRRGVFAMPWQGRTLLGTTEVQYLGDPDDCTPTVAEERYLLATLARYFDAQRPTVTTRYAGLRVLPSADGGFFDRPRDTVRLEEWDGMRGVITLYGGKLTTYRVTAVETVAVIARHLGARAPRADTASLLLPGC
ncbi:FAD-dependent oxidoreductase [Motiliproteus sp. SC1-56]|uniref:glycerol-3-phosphate dehydrogenase/oxidase n=1 Tax=Motiliproteus sp. SC1-56 TaxID=2799565 RepID=UPI001A90ACCF